MTDPRIYKTNAKIRAAFLTLSLKKPTSRITAAELSREAGINSKTFYMHYGDVESVSHEICDMLVRDVSARFTGTLESDIRVLYEFFSEQGEAVTNLLFGADHTEFAGRFFHLVFTADAFSRYLDNLDFGDIAEGYLTSAASIYAAYLKQEPKTMSVSELAHFAARLIVNGLDDTSC